MFDNLLFLLPDLLSLLVSDDSLSIESESPVSEDPSDVLDNGAGSCVFANFPLDLESKLLLSLI